MLLPKVPVIEFNNFILREINLDSDVERYYEYMSKSEVTKFLADSIKVSSMEKARQDLTYWHDITKQGYTIYWCVADKNTNKMIGNAGFNYINQAKNKASISYDLHSDYWGQGIMSRAVEKICDLANKDLSIKIIEANVAINNLRSIKLLKKNGFLFSGIIKNYAILDMQLTDVEEYIKVY